MTANISDDTLNNTSPPEDTPSPEEVLDSLARAIHEGDWQMVLEWRWDRATNTEQAISYRRARAMLDAYPNGGATEAEYAQVIADIDWTVKNGSPGRLRAKAQKVAQWFKMREQGYLL